MIHCPDSHATPIIPRPVKFDVTISAGVGDVLGDVCALDLAGDAGLFGPFVGKTARAQWLKPAIERFADSGTNRSITAGWVAPT